MAKEYSEADKRGIMLGFLHELLENVPEGKLAIYLMDNEGLTGDEIYGALSLEFSGKEEFEKAMDYFEEEKFIVSKDEAVPTKEDATKTEKKYYISWPEPEEDLKEFCGGSTVTG